MKTSRLIGSDNPQSKWVQAYNPKLGSKFEVRGVRAITAAIWGKTPAGIPKRVSSVISICNGKSSRDNIDGWYFKYIDEPTITEFETPDVLAELGI